MISVLSIVQFVHEFRICCMAEKNDGTFDPFDRSQ
jgi:hypothetical protein